MSKRLRWVLVAIAVCTVAGWWAVDALRWSNPQPQTPAPVVDLEAFNRARLALQTALIDSVAAGPEWQPAPGGMRMKWLERGEAPPALQRGDWVHWDVRVALADDTVCFARPLAFKWEATDVPTGFHELARLTGVGDSVEAWLPAHMAWGLSGYRGIVPPDVVIHLNFRVTER
jgi:hypothetical protein